MANWRARMSVLAGIMIVGVVLLAGLSMAGCDLFAEDDGYEQKENEVYVTIPEPPEGSAAWREIRVFDNSGHGTGFNVLSMKNGVLQGYVQISSPGEMTFVASIGLETNNKIAWIGSGQLNVQGKGQSIAITMAAPAPGGIGPSGGRVFYDKGNYDDNWRYLEACAAVSENCMWATSRTRIPGATDPGYGAGKANTTLMDGSSSFYPAARYCLYLYYAECYDWFLPSSDELVTLLNVLGRTSFLTLNDMPSFWTSTEGTTLEGGTDTAYVLRVQPNAFSYFEPYTYIKETRYKDYGGCKVIAARRF